MWASTPYPTSEPPDAVVTQELHDAFQDYMKARPWRHIAETNPVIVHPAADGQSLLTCVVLGSDGRDAGLLTYLHEDGLQRYLRGYDNTGNIEDTLPEFMAAYGHRDEVEPAESRRIRAAGIRYQGNHFWPYIVAVEPTPKDPAVAESAAGKSRADGRNGTARTDQYGTRPHLVRALSGEQAETMTRALTVTLKVAEMLAQVDENEDDEHEMSRPNRQAGTDAIMAIHVTTPLGTEASETDVRPTLETMPVTRNQPG